MLFSERIAFWLNKMKFRYILISLIQSASNPSYFFLNFIAFCYIGTGKTPITTKHENFAVSQ